jgi:hypothetical protein
VSVTGLDELDRSNIRVTMLTPPRDGEHRPRANQVVEFLPFAALVDRDAPIVPGDPHFNKVAAEIGAFTRVVGSFNADDNSFLIDGNINSPSGPDAVSQIRDMVHGWDERHPARAHLQDEGDVRYFYVRFWHDAPTDRDVARCSARRGSSRSSHRRGGAATTGP